MMWSYLGEYWFSHQTCLVSQKIGDTAIKRAEEGSSKKEEAEQGSTAARRRKAEQGVPKNPGK